MKATRTVTWQTKDGKTAEVTIERTLRVADKTAYADGHNVNLGKETIDLLVLTLMLDGKRVANSYVAPVVLTETICQQNYAKLKAAGAYAKLGNAYIVEEYYNKIMAAIAEAEEEVTSGEEYTEAAEVKAQEEAKKAKSAEQEAETYKKMVESGLCPKCGTWCYGDCTANDGR